MTASERNVRVVILLAGLNVAGIQRIRRILAEEFIGRGIEVDVFARDKSGPMASLFPKEVSVFEGGGRISYLWRLIQYFIARNPTHVMSSYEDITLMAFFASRFARDRPFFLSSTHNALLSVAGEGGVLKRIKYKALLLLAKFTYKKVDAVVAVSNGVAEELAAIARMPRKEIKVIYNPVRIPVPDAGSVSGEIDRFFLNVKGPVVGFLGRFHPQKNLPLLLNAFSKLPEELNATLLLVGGGEEEGALKALAEQLDISDKVVFMGFTNAPYDVMSRCDVVVLSSLYEGLGNVLIEAMSCGVQVISTDCPHGPYEILGGGEWGQLVDPGDVEGLSRAMKRSLVGEFLVPVEKLEARAADFSVNSVVDQYLTAMKLDGYVKREECERGV